MVRSEINAPFASDVFFVFVGEDSEPVAEGQRQMLRKVDINDTDAAATRSVAEQLSRAGEHSSASFEQTAV